MGNVRIAVGDCLDKLKKLPDNSVDSVVTDPPYGLSFMGKKWDYDVPSVAIWKEAFRVLKPGGHLLAFGGTRTYHRLVVNIEDAGFEIRDQIQWIYGSGFPKSLDVSKAMDKAAGAEREIVGRRDGGAGKLMEERPWNQAESYDKSIAITAPSTPLAKQWQGWGTALKPANEPICVARKPLEGTVAANVEKYGTGAINIDASRIAHSDDIKEQSNPNIRHGRFNTQYEGRDHVAYTPSTQGRWPANVIFDEEAGKLLDEQSGQEASRFFYCAKASKAERNAGLEGMPEKSTGQRIKAQSEGRTDAGKQESSFPQANFHPTVKPLKLMEYLIRLVTPPNGTVLDCFMGSGTTGVAAVNLGFSFIGIEMNEEYAEIAEKRIDVAVKSEKDAA